MSKNKIVVHNCAIIEWQGQNLFIRSICTFAFSVTILGLLALFLYTRHHTLYTLIVVIWSAALVTSFGICLYSMQVLNRRWKSFLKRHGWDGVSKYFVSVDYESYWQ
jgi:hypothetical protein